MIMAMMITHARVSERMRGKCTYVRMRIWHTSIAITITTTITATCQQQQHCQLRMVITIDLRAVQQQ